MSLFDEQPELDGMPTRIEQPERKSKARPTAAVAYRRLHVARAPACDQCVRDAMKRGALGPVDIATHERKSAKGTELLCWVHAEDRYYRDGRGQLQRGTP